MSDDARPPVHARVFRLGHEPSDDLTQLSSPEQRLEMLLVLSRRMWELTGRPVPQYSRSAMPVRLVQRR